MSLEEIKTSLWKLSTTTIVILFSVLATAGGTIYVGITTYNRVIAATEAVEAAKPYDDTEVKNEINRLKLELEGIKTSANTIKDGMVSTSNQLVAVSEKASIAKGEAMEAKASANGTAREVNAALGSVREEIKATRDGIDAQLKALKRATSNPLGN